VIAGLVITALAAGSVFLIPLVFGNLTPEARIVTRGLILVISAYLPIWALLNAHTPYPALGGT
jgi:hypothetical protein